MFADTNKFRYVETGPQCLLGFAHTYLDSFVSANSQGGRGNYLLEGQIHFALKLFVGRPAKQF